MKHLLRMDENCTLIEQAFARKERNYTHQIQILEDEIETLKKSGIKEDCTKSAKLDLQLIVDGSGSVGDDPFKLMLQQIADSLIPKLNIGVNHTRVALTQFSDDVQEEFPFTYSYDTATLQSAIKSIGYMSEGTYTGKALEETLIRFKQQQRHGDDVADACIVFTDGKTSDSDRLRRATQAWADNNTPVFAVGIGSGIEEPGLLLITGNEPSRVMQVDDFSKIAGITEDLLKTVCKAIEEKKRKAIEKAYDDLKTKCDQMKIEFDIKEKELIKKEENLNNQTRIYHQKEQQYKREIQELEDRVNDLEQNITNLLSNGSEHTVGVLSKYTFVHSRRSWNASQAYCQQMGGNLAVITTLEEERNLMRIIKEKYSWDQAFWIGAKKGEYEVGEWTWLTGETMSLEGPFVWAQENGVYQDGCLVLHPKGFMRKDVKHGGFRGQGCCDDKHAFICETTTVDPICINEKYWDWALWWKNIFSF